MAGSVSALAFSCIAVFSLWLCSLETVVATEGQTITSSLNGRKACNGDNVTMTCDVHHAGRLTWVIGSRSSDNTILFNLAMESTLMTQTDMTGQFTAHLANYSRNQQYPILGNLTSTLHTYIDTSLHSYPITIFCFNGISNNLSVPSYIRLGGPPSPPENVTVEVVYGVSEYTLIVQWNSPRDDGGVDINNYILSLNIKDGEMFVLDTETDFHTISFFLNYSTDYSLSLTASNCAGTSSSVSLTSMEAGCRAPLAAVDVIIEEYSSTEEGAVIQFHCQNGYHPTEWVTSQCINSSWSPVPFMTICTLSPSPSMIISYLYTESYFETSAKRAGYSTLTPQTSPTSTIELKPLNTTVLGIVVGIILFTSLVIAISAMMFFRHWKYKRLQKRHRIQNNSYVDVPNAQYSVIENRNMNAEDIQNGQYSLIEGSTMQDQQIPANDGDEVSVSLSLPRELLKIDTSANGSSKGLLYVQVDPKSPTIPSPQLHTNDKVTYVSVWGNAAVPPLPSDTKKKADVRVSLDQILIQLEVVTPSWRKLASAVKIEEIHSIEEYATSDKEAMVEVVDSWLRKLYPKVPTWREIADVVEEIGYSDLAFSLKQVYVTGYLPVEVTNSVSNIIAEQVLPPPLPPRQETPSLPTDPHHPPSSLSP